MTEFFSNIGTYFGQYGLRIALVACVIVVGILLAWLLSFILRKILHTTKIDDAAITFIVALVKVVIVIAIVLISASILDLSTSSLIVSLSTVALAVALALKDSLSNLANGILIISNKPFKRGDYVSINGIEGKIQNIKLLTVELITFNNTKIILPNNKVIGGDVLNYSAMPIRRVDMNFSVAYGSDMDRVERVLRRIAADDDRVLKTINPLIFMQSHDSSSIQYVFNVWVNTVDYFTVKNAMPRRVYDAFERAGISIPFNQLDVHISDQPTVQAIKPLPQKAVSVDKPMKLAKPKAETPIAATVKSQPVATKAQPTPKAAPTPIKATPTPQKAVKPTATIESKPTKVEAAKPTAKAEVKPTAKVSSKIPAAKVETLKPTAKVSSKIPAAKVETLKPTAKAKTSNAEAAKEQKSANTRGSKDKTYGRGKK